MTDIARIHKHLAVIHDPNSKIKQLYGEYYDLLWSISASERSKEEKNALKQFEIGSLPSYRTIDSRISFEVLYHKLKYFVPDLIIWGPYKTSWRKKNSGYQGFIQAARVAPSNIKSFPKMS